MFTKPRLLDQLRAEIRKRHYSYRTEKQYVGWVRRYIHFHKLRHPAELGGQHVEDFLSFFGDLAKRVRGHAGPGPGRAAVSL